MQKIITVLYFSFCLLQSALGQDYIEKSYWNYRLDWHSHKLLPSGDNGYFILAFSGAFGEHSVMHNNLIKLDSSGNQLWNYDIDTGDDGNGYSQSDFTVSPDGFIYLASNFGCSFDGNVYKIDPIGNVIWDRQFGLNIFVPSSKFYAICSAENNDQILGGAITNWNSCVAVAPYICRMAPDGSTIWEYTLDSLFPGQAINKVETFRDSTYLLHLTSVTIQIDDSGNILSSLFPTGSFIPDINGGFISFNSHQIIKLSDSLNVLWQSPVYSDRFFYDLVCDTMGNFYVTGKYSTQNDEMFISKIDSTGTILFTKLYGSDLKDEGNSILLNSDGHVTVAGSHQVHKWNVSDDHFYDCQKFITYTAEIHFVKMRTNPLTNLQCQSSTAGYTLCENDSILLTAPTGFSYQWNNGSTAQSILIDTTGTFQVTISDSLGNTEVLPIFESYEYPTPQMPHFADNVSTQCTGNFDLCLQVPYSDSVSDISYQWFRSGSQTSSFAIEWEISGLESGIHYCVASNICGSDTTGNYVLLNVPPFVALGNDTIVCTTTSVLLDAGSGNYSYTWHDGSHSQTFLASSNMADTIEFYVQKTDFSSCTSSDTIQIVFQICTDITNPLSSGNLSFYPNPSKDFIWLNDKNELIDSYIIMDAIGRIHIERTISNSHNKINISFLPPGIYFLKLKTKLGEKTFQLHKL